MPSLIGRCGGGGGTLTPGRAIYQSLAGSQASGVPVTQSLFHAAGDALFDLTDPQNPTIVADGIYSAKLLTTSGSNASAAGKIFISAASFQPASGACAITAYSNGALPTLFVPPLTFTFPTIKCEAGTVFSATVTNGDVINMTLSVQLDISRVTLL